MGYKATNIINNKIYIGKTVQNLVARKNTHLFEARNNYYPNIYFHKAIRKYGKDNFVWEILTETDSESKLNTLEKFYIAVYRKMAVLYNLTDGGEGVSGHHRISWNKGKTNCYSELTLNKIRNSLKGITLEERYGKVKADIMKFNISQRNKNKKRIFTEEWCKNISKAKTGIKLSSESIIKRTETRRKNGWNKRSI